MQNSHQHLNGWNCLLETHLHFGQNLTSHLVAQSHYLTVQKAWKKSYSIELKPMGELWKDISTINTLNCTKLLSKCEKRNLGSYDPFLILKALSLLRNHFNNSIYCIQLFNKFDQKTIGSCTLYLIPKSLEVWLVFGKRFGCPIAFADSAEGLRKNIRYNEQNSKSLWTNS